MSYTFEHTNKQGETREITILDRDEFFKLNEEEKIDYQNGPQVKTGDIVENLMYVQGFIYDIINEQDSGDNGLPEMLEQFMKSSFREKWKEGIDNCESRTEREEFYWDFIDEEGDEVLDGIDLFIINKFYESDYLYSLLLEECIRD
tara:strand:- start:1776 stop:2213 length:438 start_codon:yes stop_codon:yes gene_type:complete